MRYAIVKRRFPEVLNTGHYGSYQFAYFCANCGAESYGTFQFKANHDKSIDLAKFAYKKAEQTAVCPICGENLCRKKGYFMPDRYGTTCKIPEYFEGNGLHYPSSAKEMFGEMATLRNRLEPIEMKQKAAEFTKASDLPAEAISRPTGKVSMSSEELKEYILTLIRLENNIYSLEKRLPILYYQQLQNDRKIAFEAHEPVYKIKAELEKLRSKHQNAVKKINDAETYQPNVNVYVEYPERPQRPQLAEPGFFNKKKVQEANDALMAKYQAALEMYHQRVQKCDEEKARLIEENRAKHFAKIQKEADEAKIELERAEAEADEKMKELEACPVSAKTAVKELLNKEIAEAEELLKKTLVARNELYAYDIVFGKYRNVVALSSFYEYLMSGRCSALEGADGAYNIYENEIRANRVIAQLDTVISSLEEIKQTQYMMYEELRSINTSLQRLNSTMDKALSSIQGIEANTTSMNEYMEHISKNSDVIAHNTAVTAYYSKVNAELTDALGYMVAFK